MKEFNKYIETDQWLKNLMDELSEEDGMRLEDSFYAFKKHCTSVSLPPDFKCCMVTEEIGCAFNMKKCHICTRAIESEVSDYYAPFRRKIIDSKKHA